MNAFSTLGWKDKRGNESSIYVDAFHQQGSFDAEHLQHAGILPI
jgi:hypothetical protein